MASDTLNNAKTLKKLSASPASQQKPDRPTAQFRNACSQLRRCRCLIVNEHSSLPSFLLPVPLHHRQENSIIKPTEKRPGPHLAHTCIVMHTVKDISQSRMRFPSLQTALGTTVIGQETQFMHLLMNHEASSPSDIEPSHMLFPGRSPAQSITTTPTLLTAPSSDPRFSLRQLQSCTFVLPALLLDDDFQAPLFDLPSSTRGAPVATLAR